MGYRPPALEQKEIPGSLVSWHYRRTSFLPDTAAAIAVVESSHGRAMQATAAGILLDHPCLNIYHMIYTAASFEEALRWCNQRSAAEIEAEEPCPAGAWRRRKSL